MNRRILTRTLLVGALVVSAGTTALVLPLIASAASASFEAESGTLSQATVATNHPGYTGSGFVDYAAATGGYVELNVPATAAGPVTLAYRFANGSTATRPVAVSVNGAAAGTLSFGPTGSWSTWSTATLTVPFIAGTNTVRATATSSAGGPNLDSLTVTFDPGTSPSTSPSSPPGTDWSVAMTNSVTMTSPGSVGGWSYPIGLYMYGQYLVYKRTGDARLLTYIRAWADRFVDSAGHISNSFNSLDSMQPGVVMLALYQETGVAKYRIAATQIENRMEHSNYPRTSDNGLWHATSRQHQLWSDGVFMSLPFLARYGNLVGDKATAQNDAMNNLIVYASHLQRSDGLFWHAYDESGTQSWVVPGTKHSPEVWCRAVGWYGMASVMVLDTVPADHPQRAQVINILQRLVAGFKTYQDPATGRWFQVVDKGSQSGNWTETSCSSMYTYTISRAVEQGYVDASYKSVAAKGYQGVLQKISLGSDGKTRLTDISVGTNVGNYAYYIARTRATNDFHGLGAFLIMNEQLRRTT
jgi:unsaturated rhamnogalacturonyl hydrolase